MAIVEEERAQVKDEAQNLKQQTSEEVFNAQQKKATSCKRTRVETDDITNGDEAKSLAMERAEKVQRNLPSELRSFIKCGLPKKFCNMHLRKSDTTIVLADKRGTEYHTKYLAEKPRLSAGWRGFSIAHNLLKGDVLVFSLVQPTKFTVDTVRTNGLDGVGGGASLVYLGLEACVKQEDFASKEDLAVEDVKRRRKGEGEFLKYFFPNSPQENTKESLPESTTELALEAYQTENDSDGHALEILERTRLPESSAVDFKEVNSIKDFSIFGVLD